MVSGDSQKIAPFEWKPHTTRQFTELLTTIYAMEAFEIGREQNIL